MKREPRSAEAKPLYEPGSVVRVVHGEYKGKITDVASVEWHTDGLWIYRLNGLDNYVSEGCLRLLDDVPRSDNDPDPSPTARMAVAFLLTRIGSWTHARWDQHLRDEIGDAAADAAIEWIERTFQVKDFAARPASEPWVQEVAEKKCAERGCTRQAQYCDGCSDYCRYHYDEISNTSGT